MRVGLEWSECFPGVQRTPQLPQAISQRCAAGRNTRMIDFKEMEKVEQLNADYGAGAEHEMASS